MKRGGGPSPPIVAVIEALVLTLTTRSLIPPLPRSSSLPSRPSQIDRLAPQHASAGRHPSGCARIWGARIAVVEPVRLDRERLVRGEDAQVGVFSDSIPPFA